MRASRRALGHVIFCTVLIGLLTSCGASFNLFTEAIPAPTLTPTVAPTWQEIAPGLEWRTIVPDGDDLAQLKVLRIDPSQYHFRALNRPGQPLSLSQWRDLEPEASVIVNANFFDPDFQALGLVISDGEAFGLPYRDRGGTLMVKDGTVTIRSFRSGSIDLGEAIEQAVQGFPMLVENGGQAYFDRSSSRRSRRTIIAQDASGNILILVTPFLGMSLVDLSVYLPTTDLHIVTAVNLDGGGSTMLAAGDVDYFLPSFEAVPTVLAIFRR